MAFLFTLAICIICANASEILLNSDFESQFSGNWFCWGCKAVTTRNAYDGSSAFQTSARLGDWSGPAQKLALGTQILIDTEYRFRACVQLIGSSAGEPLKATLAYSLPDGKTSYQFIATGFINSTSSWNCLSEYFYLNSQAKTAVDLVLYIQGPKAQLNLIVDSASIETTNWKEDANKRIELFRKRDLEITIINVNSCPLYNLKIQVTQKKHFFGFGTAIDGRTLIANAKYKQRFMDNFEWAVLENEMKWWFDEPTRGQLSFQSADAAMGILRNNKKNVRGHNVFWASKDKNPAWVQQLTGADLVAAYQKRADDLVGRYAGRVQHWDVINEMLQNKFYEEAYGSKKVNYAMFRKVKEKDPNSVLFMNEYNAWEEGRLTYAYLKQAQEFIHAGAPLDAMGIQSHFHSRQCPTVLFDRLNILARAGLPIWVTEYDYADPDVRKRASVLDDVLRLAFSHRSVDGFLLWGFWDRRISRGSNASLFDGENLLPNAVGMRWQELVYRTWSTNQTLALRRVNRFGSATARVFHGVLDIKVTMNGQLVAQKEVEVLPGDVPATVDLTVGFTHEL